MKAALGDLPSDPTPQQTEKSFSEQKLEKIQALLREYPGDLFVARAQISLVEFGSPERDKLIEQYKNLSAKNPGDPKLLYLYGLTLMGRQTPQAIKLFEGAIAKDGKFAWPHLALAGIYTSRNFSNKEQAAAQAKSFLELCPASLEGYEQLTQMDNRELLTASAQKLRKQIETRSDPDAVGAYKTLWALEFKAHPPSEHGPLRKEAAADLERLRALKLEDTRQWYEALEEGYKLVNDQKQSDWAKDERLRRFPTMWELAARDNWSRDHPWPGADDPAEKQQVFYSDLLKQTGEWLKERPNTTYMWEQRLEAMKHLDVPPAEVEATAGEVLKAGEANAGPLGTDSYVYFTAAEALSKKKLEPARVVELADKVLAQGEVESRQPHSDLWSTKDNLENMNFYRAAGRVGALTFKTRAHLQLGQTLKASADIEQIGKHLPELKSLAATKDDRLKEYATHEATHWELMARLAEAGNHKLDAMAYYQTALLTRLQAGVKPPADEKDELALDAQKLWTSLGGSEQGWQMWYARPAAELAAKSTLTWEKAHEPLPEIALADIQGKTWHLSDLKGKVVLLNVWASW